MGGKGSGNRTYSNPVIANRGSSVDPDSNAKTIAYTKALYKLPKFNRGEEEEVEERIDTFFDLCAEHGMRPMVGGLALAFDMDKSSLWRIVNDSRSGCDLGFTPNTVSLLKKALIYIDSNFEQVLMDARNPVPAIFYAKSNLGWREAAQETVVTHRSETNRLPGATADEIASRYKQLAGVDESYLIAEVVEDSE